MQNRLGGWIERLANSGALPSDTEEGRRHKTVLTLLVTMSVMAGVLWAVMYWALGRPVSAAIPGGYAVATLLSLLYFLRTKRYGFFRTSQLCLITALPFLLQASLGGFVPASAVMMWSILAPFGALLFLNGRQAVPWFVAYALLTAAFSLLDGWFAPLAARAHRTGDAVRVRIGINTGPVVAGVIGTKKFVYDLWGDAVNIASRMESHGVPGAIQVAEATYERLRATYEFVERGSIEVKGKGAMRAYFLTGRRGEAVQGAASIALPANSPSVTPRPALT